MALNPPISYQGVPLRVSDEYILLHREGMELEMKVPNMKTIKMKGKLHLTSARLVMVSKNFATDNIKSVDMPLALMRKVDFKQPIFGSNYLRFDILPLYNLIPAPGSVKIWFTQGGCEKFLKIFDVATNQVAQQLKNGQRSHKPQFNQQIMNGFFANNPAYQDRNDPSYVYIQQPNETINNTNQFYGNTNYFGGAGPQNNQGMGNNMGGNPSNPFGNNMGQNQPGGMNGMGNSPGNPFGNNMGQNQNMGNFQPPQQPNNSNPGANTNYPEGPGPIQNDNYNYNNPQNQNAHATMNDPQPVNQAYNNGNVTYYFGLPVGPTLNNIT